MGHAACDINAEKHEGHVEMKEHGHDCLNLEAERTECPEEKGSRNVREKGGGRGRGVVRRHIRICCPSTGPLRGKKGPCAGTFPTAKFNQTGIQRAWGSPRAPLLGDVWLYGLLHAASSTAVDLATGPL